MKSFWITILLLLITVPAFALPVTLTDVTEFNDIGTTPGEDYISHGVNWPPLESTVNKLEAPGDFIRWAHHYDFIPPFIDIYSATLTVSIRNEELARSEFTLGIRNSGISWITNQIAGYNSEDFSYNISNLSMLEDEIVEVMLSSRAGVFYADSSTLTIDYETAETANPVPEPATILLMGMGLAGLAGFQRKRTASKK